MCGRDRFTARDQAKALKEQLNYRIDRTKPSAIPHHSEVGKFTRRVKYDNT